MKGKETTIISAVVLFVVAIGFYMLVLSPKRAEIADLDEKITSLDSSIEEQQQIISFGKQARSEFPRDYGRLVVLGKAVPDQADSASLLVQLSSKARSSGILFGGIEIAEGTGEEAATAPPAPTAPAEGDSGTTTEASAESGSTTPAAAPAPATEAGAANLPIGAVVGTAGLPTIPYALGFTGDFFGLADYMGQIDSLVQFDNENGQVKVNGRLLTVNGFLLKGGRPGSNPRLDGGLVLTSYATPSTQGATAGATSGGPAPTGVPEAAPASSTVTP